MRDWRLRSFGPYAASPGPTPALTVTLALPLALTVTLALTLALTVTLALTLALTATLAPALTSIKVRCGGGRG